MSFRRKESVSTWLANTHPRIKSESFNHQEEATHGVEVENLNAGKTTKRNAARSKAEAILVQ